MSRSVQNFSGKWNGQYTYGEGYGERFKGKSAPFTLILEVRGDGSLTGHCIDDGYENEVDTRAIIEGSIASGKIEFVKKYRHHWHTKKDGEVEENKDRESHEVEYSGRLTTDWVFTGEWQIVTALVQPDGGVVERVVGGYWIMHKEMDL